MFKIKDAWQIVEEVSTEGTWTDVRDGQVYPYKQFGNQIWMTVNFNYGGKQGDWVPNTTSQSAGHAWKYKNEQDYENWEANGIPRGAFYTIGAVRSWVVPEGWHIPTKSEWDTLVAWATSEYGSATDAQLALLANTTNWRPNQTIYSWDKFGLAGFNMVPAGMVTSSSSGSQGDSSSSNNECYFWVPNSSIASETRFEGTYFGSNTSFTFRTWGGTLNGATPIRLIKNSGVYVPQPAISTITTTLDSTGSDNKLATEKATRSAITSAVSSKMSNPMTTSGDLIVGGTNGAPSRLAAGTTGQILKVGSSGLEWGNESTGMSNPMTSINDLIIGGNSGAPTRLAAGTSGQILKVGSNGLEWANESGGGAVQSVSDTDSVDLSLDGNGDLTADIRISSLTGNTAQIITSSGGGLYVPTPELDGVITAAGDLIVGGASGIPDRLAVGSQGQVLKVGSNGPEWGTDTGMTNPMTAVNDLIIGGASGAPTRLAAGTTGQVLKVGSNGLEWGTDSTGMTNPMSASGDIIVGGTSGAPGRLAAGSQGQVLKIGSNGPEWGEDVGFANPMTAAYDLIIGGTSGAPDRLGAGSDRQILTVNGGTVAWETPLYALNADNSNDTYMFYTQFEDTNTRAGSGYENKMKTLGMNSASIGGILSLRAGTPVQAGMVTQNEPYWRTESDVFLSGHPMTAFGDIMYAGTTGSDGRRAVLALPAGNVGQVLGLEAISTIGVKPKWVDLPGTCQENFSICLSTKKENLTSNPNKLYAAKFISHETATRTKLGFYHCTGIQGIVMMGVYDKLGNLIGQTGPCTFATVPDEEMIWYDVETPFTVTVGEEYWFVFWGGKAQGEYNISLTVLQHDITTNFDPYIVGSCSYASSYTTLPSTIPSLSYETTMCYMAVK